MKAITIFFIGLSFAICLLVFPMQAAGQEYYGHWTGIKLQWTAPGDDLDVGTAHEYDLRYSTGWISNTNWSLATQVDGEPSPLPAGRLQECCVAGLATGVKYYVAIKTADEVYNWSPLSKIFSYTASDYTYKCGDVNDDGVANLADVTALVDFVYLGGQPPQPIKRGNIDGDPYEKLNLTDIASLIGQIYLNQPLRPCE